MAVNLDSPGKRNYEPEVDQESFSKFVLDIPFLPIDLLEVVKDLIENQIQIKYTLADHAIKEAWEHIEIEREPTIKELKDWRKQGRKRVSWGLHPKASKAIRILIAKEEFCDLYLVLFPHRPDTECGTVKLDTLDDLEGLREYGFS